MAQAAPVIFAAQAASQLGGAYSQYRALKTQDKYQREVSAMNAKRLERQADDVVERGHSKAANVSRGTLKLKGSQRAAYAGQGVAVDSGSASAIQAETDLMGKLDEETVKANAWREAWGYKTQADDIRAQSKMQSIQSRYQRRMTLLTGGMQAVTSLAQAGYSARGLGGGAGGAGKYNVNADAGY